jgi:hypothetical protein
MPCISDYQEPRPSEIESVRVLTLLREVGLRTEPFDKYYGSPRSLNEDTALLCNWCKANKDKVKNYSLELQIWWRDHQRADMRREEKERRERETNELKAKALAKLTEEERRALGI